MTETAASPGTAHARIDQLETQLGLAWVAIIALGVMVLAQHFGLVIAGRTVWRA